MNCKVSVVVAIYNVDQYLDQCIKSIIDQTFYDIEIILVDDGSSDQSSEICDRYASIDSRVIVIHQSNQGVSIARNNGIKNAHGEWIAFIDGDDWLPVDAIKILYDNAIQDKDCDVIAGSYYTNYSEKEVFSGEKAKVNKKYEYSLSICREKIISYTLEEVDVPELKEIKCNLSSPWAKLYRNKFLTDNQILYVPEQKRAQDEIFNLYVMQWAEKLVVINKPVYHYRIQQESICRKISSNRVSLEIFNVWDSEVKKFMDRFPYDNSKELYAFFLYKRIMNIADIYVKENCEDLSSLNETKQNLQDIFAMPEYKNMIQIANDDVSKNRYFSIKNKLALMLLIRKDFYLFIILRRIQIKKK